MLKPLFSAFDQEKLRNWWEINLYQDTNEKGRKRKESITS